VDCGNRIVHDRRQLTSRSEPDQRLPVGWRCHSSDCVKSQVTQPGRGCDFGTQPNHVNANISQIKQWSRKVAADQGMALTGLGIETTNIIIQHAERKASPTYVRRATTIGSVELPGSYGAHLIRSPCWK